MGWKGNNRKGGTKIDRKEEMQWIGKVIIGRGEQK